ncbi:hypothetical protein [Microbacterium xanthum]|uniref:hypothetical protein n=1 Tax=Microbacterium xanthum TaxID=3079794 RepID=UPI002AD255EE|nr:MULTISPECIES: hypothetical protein [unclassified Microbacterium]MDZ8172553.1 hypothetical protein [Microbacterium sp. KSW-48]MDZ8202610.1 hypothetical protein [Microbacterium sp. SSW1-59]
MRMKNWAAALAVVGATIAFSGCSSSDGPAITPVTMEVGDLQGASVDLIVGQVLNINTGDLAVDSYSGEIADTSVAEFTPGREEDGATFNPGVTALAVGSTDVVLSNDDGGIEDVTFTVTVGED